MRLTSAIASLLLVVAAHPLASQGTRVTGAHAFSAVDALDVATQSVADVSADGRWVALLSSVRRDNFGIDYRRDGDPSYIRPASATLSVIDTRQGTTRMVFPGKANVRAARWSPDGSMLAALIVTDGMIEPVLWNRESGERTALPLPDGRYVAESSDLAWSRDGASVLLSLRANAWRSRVQDRFKTMTAGPVFVQSSTEPFLSWDAIRREASTRSIVAIDVRTRRVRELAAESAMAGFVLAADGAAMVVEEDITKKTDYDVIGGHDERLVVRPLVDCAAACVPRTLIPSIKGMTLAWSLDGRRYAYSKEGKVFTGSVDDREPRQVAGVVASAGGEKKAEPDTSKAAKDSLARLRFSLVRFSPVGDALVVSNREGLWLIDAASSARTLLAASDDSTLTTPRVTVAAWTEDGKVIYLNAASRTKWERSVLRHDRTSGTTRELVRDDRFYSSLRPSRDGSSLVVSIASGNRPADLYAADGNLKTLRLLAASNPGLDRVAFGPTRLIEYLDVDGHSKYGVAYLPSGYTPGHAYPTVFSIYEDFFDDGFDASANILAGAGYVVVKPSVDFDVGHPGEAWLKGVTTAANKLIEAGIADSSRLGVHRVSYGGYATNLLITQTNRFKAAINISGKVDLVSFYTDSPRLGVRNIHAAEKSQDRIGATLWQQPQKYVEHSAIFAADRITTPLMLITGAQDSNVPADNSREMYYALRRLGKEVVWVNYMNGGHGGGNATADDFLDMQRRMIEWYDAKLKREAGPRKVAVQ
ncbi:MAG: S9 family peptidase [Polaromonas sp.]|nr:S9 family peptidase [Gemmatimonadaceae bacterium]